MRLSPHHARRHDPLPIAHRGRPLTLLAVTLIAGTLTVPRAAASTPTSTLAGAQSAAASAASVSARPAPDTKVRSVTLITGDEVVVALGSAGPRVEDIEPAPGREHMRFFTQQSGDELRVVPADAVEPLSRGLLDGRLFDVRELAELHHDRGRLPLIVQYRSGPLQRSAVAQLPAGARRTARLDAIHADAVSVDDRAARPLWQQLRVADAGPVEKVWLDGERRLSLDVSVPMVHAPEAWAADYTGAGTTVAVLDSGIDATHPDLTDAVIEARNFTTTPDTDDTAGHGTHVASIITGSGSASSGRYKGVAPDTKLLVGKVCDGFGVCPDSAVLAGMQWAAQSGADVVNLSLGGPDTSDLDPLEQEVNELTEDFGVLFVVASGNSGGAGAETVASPASADAALAVGSVTKGSEMAFSSSQGPRIIDGALKPDIVAPGVDVVAARARNGWMGSPVNDFYTSMSGTSMAAPHVAGAAAIVAQEHPSWAPSQIKALLMDAADPLPGVSAFRQGSGLLDVAEATSLPVTASPASVSFGIQRWPHDDDQPITKTVTYRNASNQPLTLDLTLRTVGPDGQPAPPGMFGLDRSTVTTPAGGESEVAITADTGVTAPDGLYTGWIEATSGATEVTTAFGVDRSIEAYDVTFDIRGRDGQPTGDYQLFLGRWEDDSFQREPYEPDGDLTLRLPAGRYFAVAQIAGSSAEGPTTTLLAMPDLRADSDKRVVFDAHAAKPVSVTIPEPSAELVSGVVSASAVVATSGEFGPSRQFWSVTANGSWSGVFVGQVGAPAAPDRFQSTVSGVWARPNGHSTFDDSPYVYNWASFAYGSVPNGLVTAPRQHDFAQVRSQYAAQGGSDKTFGLVGSLGRSPDGLAFVLFAPNLEVPVPGARTEYFSTQDIEWASFFTQNTRVEGGGWTTDAEQDSSYRPYRAGEQATVHWNSPVIGPSFTVPSFGDRPWVARQGDELSADLRLFSDANLDHVGWSSWDTGRTVLYRNGEPVFESDQPGSAFAEVPPGKGWYRLETSATRSLSSFSTRISAAWTFPSAHTDEVAALPVAAIRFLPRLDRDGDADGGRGFTIPVVIQRQPGVPSLPLRQLQVEVSYDGGATWSTAPLTRQEHEWLAHLRHPRQPGSVSLHATATDVAGNSAELTITDAYHIR